jgi:UDPglucose 6-dehydrogenase
MNSYRLVVEKSTVPVETGKWVEHTIRVYNRRKVDFDVASNPEFLREGQAIKDFLNPDRVVIGVESKRARDILLELYKPLGAPILVTDIKSAEIIKHASNSFLATKISFINVISQICEKVGADVMKVAEGMGYDKRIGRQFLNAGLGYGGACFPKDVDAFIKIAEKVGCDFKILKSVREANEDQKQNFIRKIQEALWILKDKTIGILGLSFKPGTDDMRNAPSVEIIRALQAEGALVKAFDPQAMDKAKRILRGVKFCRDPYRTAKGSDCLVIVTEWNEFKELDFLHIKKLLRQPLIIDGRNIYEPKKMKRMGFRYFGMGRR